MPGSVNVRHGQRECQLTVPKDASPQLLGYSCECNLGVLDDVIIAENKTTQASSRPEQSWAG